jgi:hypothetical protein
MTPSEQIKEFLAERSEKFLGDDLPEPAKKISKLKRTPRPQPGPPKTWKPTALLPNW